MKFKPGSGYTGLFVGLKGIQYLLNSQNLSIWNMYQRLHLFGGFFYPLSRSVLLFAIGAGVLCGKKESIQGQVVPEYTKSHYDEKRGNNAMGYKNKLTAILLSVFVGGLGIDRFYLGYTGLGVVTRLTLGGFGIWALIVLVMICTGSLRPADGSPWEEEVQKEQLTATVKSTVAQPMQNNSTNSIEAIEKLAKLHEQGILTDDEFQQKKADLLAKM